MSEASALRDLDENQINSTLDRRHQWRMAAQQRWQSQGMAWTAISPPRLSSGITPETRHNLLEIAQVLNQTTAKFKHVTGVQNVWIYTNDLSLFDSLSNLNSIRGAMFTQAIVARPRNTVCLKNPQWGTRTYFRNLNLTAKEKQHIQNFLENNRDNLRASPALLRWCDDGYLRLQDWYFVDHTDPGLLLLLNLIRPGLIRKSQPIIADK